MPWWFVIMANWELKKTNISFGYCWQLIILYLQKVQEIWYSQKKVNIQRNLQIIYYKGFGNKWILNIKNNENVIVLLNDQETPIFPTQILVHKANFFKLLKLQFVYQ